MSEPNFWDDPDRARELSSRHAECKEIVALWDGILGDVEALESMASDNKSSDAEELNAMFEATQSRFKQYEFQALFTEKYDKNSAIMAIHAGTGGVDAMDWAENLLRMYLRFCEKKGWRVTILDEQYGQEAGIKRVDLEIKGSFAYGYLKAEHGVHRLVRISPFDAEGMRHTSFALVEVIPDLGHMDEIIVKPEDLRIDVYRASGKGGQGVNTTDSAVRITHIPTGIVVTCQNERSQMQNKETAMRYLKAKLHRLALAEREDERLALRGQYTESSWGNQARSYVLNPYRLVKDHRTGYETQNTQGVLDGELMPFMEAYLHWIKEKDTKQD